MFNNTGVRTNNVDVKRITSGLIVCRTILEQYGGSITLSPNRQTQGITVSFQMKMECSESSDLLSEDLEATNRSNLTMLNSNNQEAFD